MLCLPLGSNRTKLIGSGPGGGEAVPEDKATAEGDEEGSSGAR